MAENSVENGLNSFNIHPESFMVEGLYRDLLGEFSFYKNPTFYGNNCPHWIVPSINLSTDVSTHLPSNSRFNFQIQRPRPFLPPSNTRPASFRKGDPLEAVVQKKQKWSSDLHTLLGIAKKGKKWADQQLHGLHTDKVKKKSNSKHIYTVGSYVDVAKHFEKDPDPHFSGNYNWLYTGGCITNCTVDERKHLIFPQKENMDTLCVLEFKEQGTLFRVEKTPPSISVPLVQGQRIHQIVANQSNGLIGIRQDHACSVVLLKKGSKKPLKTRVLLEIQEEDSHFLSIDMNPLEAHQMCTSDTNKLLKLWDLNSGLCTSSIKISAPDNESNSSQWSILKFGDKPQEMFVSNRSTVFVKDLRMPLSESAMEFPIRPLVDNCEDVTLLLVSPSSSLTFVGTSHRLLSLDCRFGWSQRWTHLMEGPPMYGSISSVARNAEVVLLSSSIPDDTVAIVNKLGSESLPRSLPSLKDCLVLARSHGECLGPNLKKRLDMATAGLTVLPSEDCFTSLKITSIGDVFSHKFLQESRILDKTEDPYIEEVIECDIEAWKNWEKADDDLDLQNSHELLNATFSQEPIYRAITAPLEKDKDAMIKSDITQWQETYPEKTRLKWIKHNFPFEHDTVNYGELMYELSSYKDLMAGVLLQAWDSQGLYSVPEPSKYVKTWLDSVSPGERDSDTSSLSDFGGASAPISSQSLMSMYSEKLDQGTNAGDSLFKVPPTPKSMPSKKVKREKLGF